jgi:hypothetical protein
MTMHSRAWFHLLLVLGVACSGDRSPHAGSGDAGSTSAPDAAMPAVCGDGVVQPPETCDPASTCPSVCPPIACKTASLGGSPASCDVVCGYATITLCASGDGCCPAACTPLNDIDCSGIRIDDYYAGQYSLLDLGAAPAVPPLYGGLTVDASDPSKLLIGGRANTAEGALYAIGIVRDDHKHITGFSGTAVRVADAGYNDGSFLYGPSGVMFMTRWPVNELGFMKQGSVVTDKIIPLTPLGVANSVASAAFGPPGAEFAGLKLLSWEGGEWYSAGFTPDTTGTFDLTPPMYVLTLPGGPEGIVYVPTGSPLFPNQALLVSEYTAGVVSTFDVNTSGDPLLNTRRRFVIGLTGAEGATIDPTSGDFLFSTFGGGDRIIVVRGFSPIG